MGLLTYSRPGEGDPRNIFPDGESPLKGLPWVDGAREAIKADAPYRAIKCYKLGLNREFVGYLSTRGNQSVAIGDDKEAYPHAKCHWVEKDGATYLAKATEPFDRCLGLGDFGYASWALQQARNMGYYTNVIYNPDHTISPGIYPDTYLAGPYEKYGIDWCWWAPRGNPSILVCELEVT